MSKKQRIPEKYAPKVRTKQFRKDDKMVTVTTEVRPAIVDFQDILAATVVEEDHDCNAPWEDSDGWEHEWIPCWRLNTEKCWGRPTKGGWLNYYNEDDVARVASNDHRLILLSFEQVLQWIGGPHLGEHKQVHWERLAEYRRRSLDQLKKWYEDGWVYYGVVCKFMDYCESLWGIQTEDDNPTDPYLDECREEIADQVAAEMSEHGYTVMGRPDWLARRNSRAAKQTSLRWKIAHNLGFSKPEEYLTWLMKRNP